MEKYKCNVPQVNDILEFVHADDLNEAKEIQIQLISELDSNGDMLKIQGKVTREKIEEAIKDYPLTEESAVDIARGTNYSGA